MKKKPLFLFLISLFIAPLTICTSLSQDKIINLGGDIVNILGKNPIQRKTSNPNNRLSKQTYRFARENSEQEISDGFELAGNRENAIQIQVALKFFGIYTGVVDGDVGPKTKISIKTFQNKIGTKETGKLTKGEAKILLSLYTDGLLDSKSNNKIIDPKYVSYVRNDIYSSRLFAGPDDYPPSDFAAYGILAFKSKASAYDRERHLMICEAFVKSILPFRILRVPKKQQMVTVWPVENAQLASMLDERNKNPCDRAVDGYGILAARKALKQAEAAGVSLDSTGPYMLAWSPSKAKGSDNAIVLVADLSEVHDYDQAVTVMFDWTQDIERDPALWSHGWLLEPIRIRMQRWFDRQGTQMLRIFHNS